MSPRTRTRERRPAWSRARVPRRPVAVARPPRLHLLGRVDGVQIYLVSGERVRDEIDVDFTEGGNDAVYTYVPAGEVWIDDAAHALDRTATALHELVERDLMLRRGLSYDEAHDAANERERALRRDLVRRRPARFDLDRVAGAYRDYLGGIAWR